MPTLCLWNAASTMARPANRGNSRLDHQILARGDSDFGGAPIEMDFDLMQVHQGWWRQHSRSLPKEHNYHNDHRLLWQLNKPSQAPEEAERKGASLPAPADGRESTSQNAQVRVSQCVLQRICRPAALPMRLQLGRLKAFANPKRLRERKPHSKMKNVKRDSGKQNSGWTWPILECPFANRLMLIYRKEKSYSRKRFRFGLYSDARSAHFRTQSAHPTGPIWQANLIGEACGLLPIGRPSSHPELLELQSILLVPSARSSQDIPISFRIAFP